VLSEELGPGQQYRGLTLVNPFEWLAMEISNLVSLTKTQIALACMAL